MILLVEDNRVNQKVAVKLLEKMGCSADVAANGVEGLKALEATPYDLVLMDCQMPEMDGYEATRVIRDRSSSVLNHDIPAVAMTASAMLGDREECLAAGMKDYIAKPFSPWHLCEVIERCLSQPVDRQEVTLHTSS